MTDRGDRLFLPSERRGSIRSLRCLEMEQFGRVTAGDYDHLVVAVDFSDRSVDFSDRDVYLATRGLLARNLLAPGPRTDG